MGHEVAPLPHLSEGAIGAPRPRPTGHGVPTTANPASASRANRLRRRTPLHATQVLCRGAGGVERDVPRGTRWVREAAEMGHPAAQAAMGSGLAPDAEAEVWLRRAAEHGDGEALRTLGRRLVQRGEMGEALRLAARWCSRLGPSSKWAWT